MIRSVRIYSRIRIMFITAPEDHGLTCLSRCAQDRPVDEWRSSAAGFRSASLRAELHTEAFILYPFLLQTKTAP